MPNCTYRFYYLDKDFIQNMKKLYGGTILDGVWTVSVEKDSLIEEELIWATKTNPKLIPYDQLIAGHAGEVRRFAMKTAESAEKMAKELGGFANGNRVSVRLVGSPIRDSQMLGKILTDGGKQIYC